MFEYASRPERHDQKRRVRRSSAFLFSLVILCTLFATTAARAQYDSENVSLLSQIELGQFGDRADAGNDCWGYVSPTGREYAIMGLYGKTAFVEVTDPENPVIVASIDHDGSDWSDIKTYRQFAYVSNETGGGTQVIDLSDIDNGNVTLTTELLPLTSHNLAINEESGFLYLLGSHSLSSGLVVYDLNQDPANPEYVGYWRGNYIHDAQIVNLDRAPYRGKEIAFCCAANTFMIMDVTNKNRMYPVSKTTYPGISYCHQGWLSADQRFFYLDDEGDEIDGKTPTTRTLIFDVTDLREPVFLGSFTSGRASTDHNLYVRDNFIYEANYRSGLQVFDASDPINPAHVGFFDTYPSNDRPGYNGAWGVYPFLPSGIVIVSDIERGLFILDVSEARRQRRIIMDQPTLFAGERTTFTASNAPQSETAYFIYSTVGPGALYVESVNAMIGLSKPQLLGTETVDADGNVALDVPIPNGTIGIHAYFQIITDGRTSNVTDAVIE